MASPPCSRSFNASLFESPNATQSRFCSDIEDSVGVVYFAVSLLSTVSCLWVFATYLLFPRLSGYSSKVFLNRTAVDLLIALGHIVSFIFNLPSVSSSGQRVGCGILGAFNEFLLVAGNFWYAMLAIDLLKAIRNPFRAKHSFGVRTQIFVWGSSLLLTVILSGFKPGVSMFYWCWISVETSLLEFTLLSFFLYYLLHFLLWIFSLAVLAFAATILHGHLPASSETRRFVLKQNVAYVLILGIETSLLIPIWVAQLGVLRSRDELDGNSAPLFFTDVSWALSVCFAIVHSLRGTVDLFVWWFTFAIGLKDFKRLYQRIKHRLRPTQYYPPAHTLSTPLIGDEGPSSTINRALRRDAIYCINVGILDAVKLNALEESRRNNMDSVRDTFVAQAMIHWDGVNQENETEQLHENPYYREQTERTLQFPPMGRLQKFSFADIEPSVFSLLRNSYGISPRVYRESFKIKNAADVESSGMLEKFTEGKSGSFFYFTRDFRYLIKTVTASEERFLQRIAYRYYRHMRMYPDSVIVRLFGLHKVRLAREQRYITVVVMDNIFQNNNSLKIHEKYDLKGSTVGRRVLKSGRERVSYKGTLKDLDLDKRIIVGAEAREQLMKQLQLDVEFLTSLHIMDYSMLLGMHHHNPGEASQQWLHSEEIQLDGAGDEFQNIDVNVGTGVVHNTPSHAAGQTAEYRSGSRHYSHSSRTTLDSMEESREMEQHVPWFRRDCGGLRSHSPFHPCSMADQEQDGEGPANITTEGYRDLDVHSLPVDTYYFGIVDILQPYNLGKSIEHFTKTRILCKERMGISAVNEVDYGRRFLEAMERTFE